MRAFLLQATTPETRDSLPSPWSDRDYWLARCVGFDVFHGDRLVGRVVALLYGSRHDRPDAVLVRWGPPLNRREIAVPIDQVSIDPNEEAVFAEGLADRPSGLVGAIGRLLAPTHHHRAAH